MREQERKYKRDWMRKKRSQDAWKKAIAKGHCPVCSMLLVSTYHIRCRYLDDKPPQSLDNLDNQQ